VPLPDDSLEKWIYREHTKIKHEILGKYLKAWATVLGGFYDLNVFDCFAGRGRYIEGEEGSPFIIINSIAEIREKANRPNEACCVFIEKNESNFRNLREEISELCRKHSNWLDVELYNDEFGNVAKEIIEKYDKTLAPSFFFIDPFGFGGVPFGIIKDILSIKKSEVFITFMVRDVLRFLGSSAHRHSIEELYGIGDVSGKLIQEYSHLPQEQALLKSYRDRLHDDANVVYTFSFRVNADERLQTTYYLIHCTSNPLGCEIMKEIMCKSGTEGRYGYLGPAEGQMVLHQFEGVGKLKDFLLQRFNGRSISYKKVRHETLMDTDYSRKDYRKAILGLSDEGRVTIEGIGPRGGLPDTAIITF
jgi:three-Cys-motif partner protein